MNAAVDTSAPAAPPATVLIPIGKLKPSPYNRTIVLDDGFVESIRSKGIYQPLLVRPLKGDTFEIVFGHRRHAGAKKAGRAEVPAMVREMTDKEVLEAQLIENVQRQDVHPIEEAEGYNRLLTDHGYAVEDLAAKIGKSKGYIYGRLKLRALGEKAQRAALEGKVSSSVALLLARIPDAKLQDEALAWATRSTYHGEPPSFRQVKDHLEHEFSCSLKEAGFDLKDETLVPEAGTCTKCPHRSGNQRELFGETSGRADVCTNPPCFQKKRDADWSRKAEAARGKGLRVLTDAEAKKAIPRWSGDTSTGYVALDSHHRDDPKDRKWSTLLGKAAAAETVIARDEHGVTHELVPAKAAREILKEKHPAIVERDRGGGGDAYRAQQKAREAKAKRTREIRSLALTEIVAAAEKGEKFPEAFWRVVAEAMIDLSSHETQSDTVKRRELGDARNSGKAEKSLLAAAAKMTAPQLRGLVVELMAYVHVSSWAGDHLGKRLSSFCSYYGVSLKKVAAGVAKARKKAPKKGAKKR